MKFDISGLGKNLEANYQEEFSTISLSNAIINLKASVEKQLEEVEYTMFSKTRSVMKVVYKNLKTYLKLLELAKRIELAKAGDALKKMAEVEKLIEKDNKKIESLLDKIEKGYNKKEEKDKPRILQGENRKNLEKTLSNLLKFVGKCVDRQKEIAISKTKKGSEDSSKEASVKKLIEVFTFNNSSDSDFDEFSKFANNFLKSNVVDAYIKKRISTTGKILKQIYKYVDDYNKTFNSFPKKIRIGLSEGESVKLWTSVDLPSEKTERISVIKDMVQKVSHVINVLEALKNVLDAVVKYRGKQEKLISLYDPRVKNKIRILVDDGLKEVLNDYKTAKNTLTNALL